MIAPEKRFAFFPDHVVSCQTIIKPRLQSRGFGMRRGKQISAARCDPTCAAAFPATRSRMAPMGGLPGRRMSSVLYSRPQEFWL
jgi:hypothetical protein